MTELEFLTGTAPIDILMLRHDPTAETLADLYERYRKLADAWYLADADSKPNPAPMVAAWKAIREAMRSTVRAMDNMDAWN